MDPKDAFERIKRNTQEIVSEDELMQVLERGNVTAYFGTAPTGMVHTGYLIPITKIADFLEAGVEFTILLADLHSHLDDMKSPFELLKHRSEYYKQVILGLFEGIGVSTDSLKFVLGSEFELKEQYALDLLRMSSIVTYGRSRRAGAEVVRQKDDPKLGSFIYPLMQSIDVPHLKADIAFGGIDQRGIYMLGREILPKLGYKKPICVFTPLLPGLTGGKMSASDEGSKINCHDSAKIVKKKMNKSFCPEKEVEGNGVLSLVKTVIAPYAERMGKDIEIVRPEKFGGTISFSDYTALEKAYVSGDLHPLDLKQGVAAYLNIFLEPVRKRLSANPAILKNAYPKNQ